MTKTVTGRIRLFTFLAAVSLTLPLLLGQFWRFTADAESDTSYLGGRVSYDEAFTLAPAQKIYEGGYFAYRCREGQTATCYGGTQAFLDALTFRLLPRAWLEGIELSPGPAQPWPGLVRYPRMLTVLRWSRVLHAATLVLAVGLLGFVASGDWLVGALFTLILGSSPVFADSWQGATNAFGSALWEVIFLLAALLSFRRLARGGRTAPRTPDWPFLLTFVIGLLGSLVRPILLPTVVLYVPLQLGLRLSLKGTGPWLRRARNVAVDLVLALAIGTLIYCALQPNTFVSSTEAAWLPLFFSMIGRVASSADRLVELRSALAMSWPALFVAAAVVIVGVGRRQRGFKTPLSALLLEGVFPLVCAVVFFWLNLRGSYHRLSYYLPSLTLLLVTLAWFWPTRASKFGECFAPALALATVVAALLSFGSPLTAWRALADARPAPRGALDLLINEQADARDALWLLDVSLRPPVRRPAHEAKRVAYFDSLSDTPATVLGRLNTFGGLRGLRVVVTCWSPDGAGLAASGLDSPNTRLWAAVTKPFCPSSETVVPASFEPFADTYRTRTYAVVRALDLLNRWAPGQLDAGSFLGRRLSPRVLEGAWKGMDRFRMPLVLEHSVDLATTLVFPRGLKRVVVPVSSTCRDPVSSVGLTVRSGSAVWSTGSLVLDTSEAFCREDPELCGYAWYRAWAERWHPPRRAVALDVRVPAGGRARLELRATQSACQLLVNELQLKF